MIPEVEAVNQTCHLWKMTNLLRRIQWRWIWRKDSFKNVKKKKGLRDCTKMSRNSLCEHLVINFKKEDKIPVLYVTLFLIGRRRLHHGSNCPVRRRVIPHIFPSAPEPWCQIRLLSGIWILSGSLVARTRIHRVLQIPRLCTNKRADPASEAGTSYL